MGKDLHRVILVSDMHYTTEETPEQMRLIRPDVRTSVAAGDAFGYTQKEKVAFVLSDLLSQGDDVDAVFVLGDLSIDDYSYRNLPDNYCRKFKEECMDKLPCPSYAIAGNHDSYPDAVWQEIFGYGRQFSVKLHDAVFIMLDTFHHVPATGASGSAYTDVDIAFLKQELEKYLTEKVFLCAHHFKTHENEEFARILRENDRIVCLFRGHTHINAVLRPESLSGKTLVDIGGYGYMGRNEDGKWIFNTFDPAWAWGYEVLEWDQTHVHMYHVKPKRRYLGGNGEFDYPGAIEDDICWEI